MRLHLTFAIITALLLFLTLRSREGRHFSFARVDKLAADRTKLAYAPMPDSLPAELRNLTPQQEEDIKFKDTFRLWRTKGLPFQVDFYHLSREFPFAPQIDTVDHKGAHLLAYSPSFFQFPPGLNVSSFVPGKMGYAGFYVRYPDMIEGSKPNSLDGFFTTQGASYFRAIARDQVYGLSARGLCLDTALDGPNHERGKTEEFPFFTRWWLHEPAPNAGEMVMDALLESPSVVGAYEFHVRPGDQTSIDVHASLYFRKDVAQIGLDPFSSMYFFGENAKNHFGDTFHPEIHDSDGLLIDNGKGEWIWRPLQQTPMQQYYPIAEESPSGFGLMQRDRDFQHYQDPVMKYNVRPSVWVTPRGNWGKGEVTLFQLPTNNTNTDNVVLFWQPDRAPRAGDHLVVDYRIDFFMNDAARPPVAYTRDTFVNDPAPPPPSPPPPQPPPPAALAAIIPAPSSSKSSRAAASPSAPPAPALPATPPPKKPPFDTTPVQFLVDFMGNGLENIPANSAPDLELSAEPSGTVVREKSVEKNDFDKSWRVTFTITPREHFVPTELKCRLMPHATTSRLQDEIGQLQNQVQRAELANDESAVRNLRANALPQKLKALQEADRHPLTETWTYTWYQ